MSCLGQAPCCGKNNSASVYASGTPSAYNNPRESLPDSPVCGSGELALQTTFLSTASLTILLKAEVLAEERHYMILKAVGHGTGVSARIYLEAVGDFILIKSIV